jgi:hypothetical protein
MVPREAQDAVIAARLLEVWLYIRLQRSPRDYLIDRTSPDGSKRIRLNMRIGPAGIAITDVNVINREEDGSIVSYYKDSTGKVMGRVEKDGVVKNIEIPPTGPEPKVPELDGHLVPNLIVLAVFLREGKVSPNRKLPSFGGTCPKKRESAEGKVVSWDDRRILVSTPDGRFVYFDRDEWEEFGSCRALWYRFRSVESLDDLHVGIIAKEIPLQRDMPKFGKEGHPSAHRTTGVWSWDAKRILFGNTAADLRFISRIRWEYERGAFQTEEDGWKIRFSRYFKKSDRIPKKVLRCAHEWSIVEHRTDDEGGAMITEVCRRCSWKRARYQVGNSGHPTTSSNTSTCPVDGAS